MTGILTLDDYDIERDSNGDLVIKDPSDNTVLTWDNTNGKWVMGLNAPLDISEIIDGAGTSHTGELEDIDHVSKHESGGADEISVTGLSGDLADEQDPKAHANEHAEGAADPLDVGTLVDFDPEEFLIGTQANQPTAGTADRIYLITDASGGPVIERDNGTSWEVYGAAPGALENGGYAEMNVGGLSGDLADAQDPKAHTTTHQDGGSDEVPVETLPANSTDTSQFFAPDGAGGVTTAAAGGNVPNWQEDGNSPINSTGSQTSTITLNNTYDYILILVQEWTGESTMRYQIRANGDTGTNYTNIHPDGTSTSSEPAWLNAEFGSSGFVGRLELTANNQWRPTITAGPFGQGSSSDLDYGYNGNITMPVDSITFRGESTVDGSDNITIKARVYGWNGGL